MDKQLYVNEIFQAPQGEGFFTGRMAIFIRFAGCNLECEFCDTKYSREIESGKPYTGAGLVGYIMSQQYRSKFVVLTGGEPMLQDQDTLSRFISMLKKRGYFVAMETNGTKSINKFFLGIDWVTVSPKTALFETEGDELKLLYDGTQDLGFYEQFKFQYFYLQPILPERGLFINDLDTKIILPMFQRAVQDVKKAVEERPIWRISFQTQKLAGYR